MATKESKQRLTLHYLFGALSFWGTSVRVLLMAFLAGAVFLAQVIENPGTYASELQSFIYVVGSFFVLDAGYVTIARSQPLSKVADMTVLLLADAALALAYIVPNFVHMPGLVWISRWSILSVLFILSVRTLLGLLAAHSRK